MKGLTAEEYKLSLGIQWPVERYPRTGFNFFGGFSDDFVGLAIQEAQFIFVTISRRELAKGIFTWTHVLQSPC